MEYRQPFEGSFPITQGYGDHDTSAFHTGIDYACPIGTPVLASEAGTVVKAGWDNTGYGNCVIIQHSDGNATLYAHMTAPLMVTVGQKVKRSQLLGYSGSTGNSTGPHLHFEARRVWYDYKTHEDPITFLPLMTYADASTYTEQQSLKNAGDFPPGTMEIVAPAGAKAFDLKFSSFNVLQPGTRVNYTGNSVQRAGYEYLQCFATFYIAVNDHETQILDRVK